MAQEERSQQRPPPPALRTRRPAAQACTGRPPQALNSQEGLS